MTGMFLQGCEVWLPMYTLFWRGGLRVCSTESTVAANAKNILGTTPRLLARVTIGRDRIRLALDLESIGRTWLSSPISTPAASWCSPSMAATDHAARSDKQISGHRAPAPEQRSGLDDFSNLSVLWMTATRRSRCGRSPNRLRRHE